MLKTKYLHRKSRSHHDRWEVKKYWRCKNIDMFSDLPYHQSIRNGYWNYNYSLTPLLNFIESKIGQNWDDVYSEILTKIDNKYRDSVDSYLFRHFYYEGITLNPIYDDDYIPRNYYGRILADRIFREGGILVKKSKQQIISDAKKYQRKEKLNRILENKDKNYTIEEFDQKKYDEYFIKDGEERMKKYRKN